MRTAKSEHDPEILRARSSPRLARPGREGSGDGPDRGAIGRALRSPLPGTPFGASAAFGALGLEWAARERRLVALARARAPLRRALATLALRWVEARGWERFDFARLADHAHERLGLSARQLQDLACTAHRLDALPAVDAAFRAGALPWTKARLVARAAARDASGGPLRLHRPRRHAAASPPRVAPEFEARWLARARALPADALEHQVRAVDRASIEGGALEVDEDGRPVAIPQGVVLRCNPRTAGKLHRGRQVARRVAGEKLPGWACMEALAAEAVSAVGLDTPDAAEPPRAEGVPPLATIAAPTERSAGDGADPSLGAADPGAASSHAAQPTLGASAFDLARHATPRCHGAGFPLPAAAREPRSEGPETQTRRQLAPVGEAKGPSGAASESMAASPTAPPPRPIATAPEPTATAPALAAVPDAPAPSPVAPEAPAIRALTEDLEAADAFELEARLRRAVALEQRLEAEMAPLLRALVEERVHRMAGFATLGAWLRERVGLSPRKARELVRLDRVATRCGALRRAFAEARIPWTGARALLPLLERPEAEGFRSAWVARAERVSVRRLEDDVAAALHALDVGDADFPLTGGLPDERARLDRKRREPTPPERPIRAQATGAEVEVGMAEDAAQQTGPAALVEAAAQPTGSMDLVEDAAGPAGPADPTSPTADERPIRARTTEAEWPAEDAVQPARPAGLAEDALQPALPAGLAKDAAGSAGPAGPASPMADERPIRAQATGVDARPERLSFAARRRAETRRPFFVAPPEVACFFRAALASVRRHLERSLEAPVTEGEALEAMLDHALATWGADGGADGGEGRRVPRAHRVFERDGWRCTVPGCSSYRNLHDHHVVFRAQGGSDALENRTTLCAFHHLRGVHGGRIRCRGRAPHGLHFELGLRGGGPPLLRYGPGEVVLHA